MFSKNRISKILITILIILTTFSIGITVYAEELQVQFQEREYSQAYKKWLELDEDEKQKVIQPAPYVINITPKEEYNLKTRFSTYEQTINQLGQTDLPSQYKIPNLVVKDQMNTGSCWAFSFNSAVESTYLKQKGEAIDLSERHMEYATAKTLLDENGEETENPIGFNKGTAGGVPITGAIYSTNGTGLVYEEDMPFENNMDLEKLSEVMSKKRKVKITDYKIFPEIYKLRTGDVVTYSNGNSLTYSLSEVEQARQEMKEHIYNYGGITTCTYMEGGLNYLNVDTQKNRTSYYCPNFQYNADHAITIVGWDDTYSKLNFKSGMQPTTDGAWICLNSWGEDSLPGDGYVYVSYEDVYVEMMFLYGITGVEKVKDEKIYQHDFYGAWNGLELSQIDSSTIYTANIFTKDTNDTEYLTEVSINTLVEQQIEVFIKNAGKEIYTKNLGTVDIGYHTIKLEKPILLEQGEIEIITKNTAISGKPVMTVETENVYTSKVESNLEESFYSVNGEQWIDLKIGFTNAPANFCIKAFTQSELPVEQITLNKNQTTININETETLTATVLPENATNKTVTWESDDTDIATVDQTGLVTGKAEGTATITATSQDGLVKAECKVTVQKVAVNSITLNKNQTILGINQTEKLTATILPENATNKNVIWESNDTDIATVDQTGLVTGKTEGRAIITVKSQDDNTKIATCTVTVQEEPITISSEVYLIEEEYISKVKPNTTKQQFLSNIQTNGIITIYDGEEEITQGTAAIKTGMILKLNNGNQYEIVVTGDLNGDGQLGTVDLSKMKLHQVGIKPLSGIYLKAADLDYNQNINLADLSKIKLVIVGLREI